MKKFIKFALIVLAVYLAITIIGFLGARILGASPISILFGLPAILVNIPGILLAPFLLPASTCSPSGFMGCESSVGMAVTFVINILLYFMIALALGKLIYKN